MRRLRKILLVLAIIGGVGGAVAFERPGLFKPKRFSCSDTPYPGCLSSNQYVVGQGGQLVHAPPSGEGSSWVCMYNTIYVCTYAYMYCSEWGEMRFIPCKKGTFCWFTPTYGCSPFPPWLAEANTGVMATPEADGSIRLTAEQQVIVEKQIEERKKSLGIE